MTLKVNVKWSKELFKDVEVDISQPPIVFKGQLFALSGVPPDRQKVMVKGGLLKDDEWGKAVPKAGQTLMMMGTADVIPTEIPKTTLFVEDLPEKEQAWSGMKQFGKGLANLGNTCYMNSTVQCLYKVPQLRTALKQFTGAATTPANKLMIAARDLFKEMEQGGEPLTPYLFLMSLRERFPQFSQTTNQGAYMQQDAEECWTQLMYSLKEGLKGSDGVSPVEETFGIGLRTKLVCEETKEEMQDEALNYMLKCNISGEVNFLVQGIKLGLKEDREKNSAQLGRLALFQGSSVVTKLPLHLTVQMVRFFYKADVQQKAKILRKVTYPLELDMYEFCSPELQAALEGPRNRAKEIEDRLVEERKLAKVAKAGESSTPASAAAASAGGDAEMKDSASTSATASDMAMTGKYELVGVLTHKGRSADSGHYVSWVKQEDGQWVLYDDDELHFKKDEEILALSGGGDWHMAYLLLYRAKTVPMGAEGAKVVVEGETAAEGEAMETGA